MKLIVDDWKDGWKWATTWVFAFIIAFPDLLPLVEATGLLTAPEVPAWVALSFRTLGTVGIFARFWNQKRSAK